MTAGRKIGLAVLVVVGAALIVLAIAIPRLADLDRNRPELIARLEQATGRSVAIGRLSLSVLPIPVVRADQIAIGNPPGFPQRPFLRIRRADAGLDLAALLHRRFAVRALKLEDPVLNLVSNGAGRWNAGRAPQPQIQPAAWVTAPAGTISVGKVELQNGSVFASIELRSGEIEPPEFEAEGVSVDLEIVSPDALGVHLTARDEPGSGSAAQLDAPWGALLRRVALVAAEPGAGPGELYPLRAPGRLGARGTFNAASVRAGEIQSGPLKSGLEIYSGGVMLNGLSLGLSGGRVTGDAVWDSSSQPGRYSTRLAFASIDLARLLQAVPGGRGKITGTLDGRLDLTGRNAPSPDPLANVEGSGNVTVSKGTLPTLQLNKNLMLLMKSVLNAREASGDPSSFRSVTADLEIGGGLVHSRRITLLGHGVDADASGSLALAGAGRLDYTGVARISARTTGFTGLIAGALGAKMAADGTVNLPFTLTGTLEQPHFGLKNSRLFH